MMLWINIVFLTYLAASVLASAFLEPGTWGLYSWGFFSLTFGFILALLMITLTSERASERFAGLCRWRIRSRIRRMVLFAALAAFLFLILRMRHNFWGEGEIAAAAIESNAIIRPGSPLPSLLNYALYRFLNPAFLWSPQTVSAALSILAGALFTVSILYIAELLFDDEEEMQSAGPIAAAVLFFNGCTAVFFGAGGNAPIAVLSVSLFIIGSILYIRNRVALIVPALLFLAALISHLANAYLLPGFIYLLIIEFRSKEWKRRAIIAASVVAVCWVALELVISRVTGGPGPTRFIAGIITEELRDFSVPHDPLNHLLDAANGYLLIGPASFFALIFLVVTIVRGGKGTSIGRLESFLALLAVAAVVMQLAGAGLLKDGLRWDAFTSTGPALAVFLVLAIRRYMPGIRGYRRTAALLIALGIFHTLPWIVINARPSMAEQRLLHLPLAPGRAEMIIADRALAEHDLDRAEQWYSASVERDSLNTTALYRLGGIEMEREDYLDAISHYYRAKELSPGNIEYRYRLAEAYISNRWYNEAITELEGLIEIDPGKVLFWKRLGHAQNHGMMFADAIASYERALLMEPDDEQNVKNLTSAVLNRGAELQEDGELEAARNLYYRAIGLYPDDWRAANNLAAMAIKQGDIDRAYLLLKSALEQHPFASELNFNMGIVLEKKGRKRQALQFLQRAADLNPMHSSANDHIMRIQRELMEEERD